MSDAQALPNRVRLGIELRRLRELAGLNQDDVAAATGVSQATIHRIEAGAPEGRPPSWPKVQAWAQASQAAGPDMEWLRTLTEAATAEHALFRNRLPAVGLAGVQEEVRAEEAITRTLRNFNPWGVPGLLQTPGYARSVLNLADYRGEGVADAAVEARIRRQSILSDPARQFEFVLTEAALRWKPGRNPVLPQQLAHLAGVITLPTITFRVIPSGALAHAIPSCGFILYEDRSDGAPPFAAVEVPHTQLTVDKPADLDIYRRMYDLMRQAAISGPEAAEFVGAVARSLEQAK